VKKLNDVIQGDPEFRSELSVIERIKHMNLVRIWGFCVGKIHKLLVSKFLENGSLATILFDFQSVSPVLQWGQRYNIELGVVKGLAYLHHDCLEWIVHCDVKPENILLDKNFEPKIRVWTREVTTARIKRTNVVKSAWDQRLHCTRMGSKSSNHR
jgi:serine/threonine protein kinase